jgi:hypothetical protein
MKPFSNNQKSQMGPQIFQHFPTLSLTFSLFLLRSLLLLLTNTTTTTTSTATTIYDHLRLNGLPTGLLPKGITNFSVSPATSLFQISLPNPCIAKIENQLLYDPNISFHLTHAYIGNLSGVSAQELFLWFPVKGIRVDVPSSGVIHFDVGVVDKQYALSLFESPLDCTAADPLDPSDFVGGGRPDSESLKVSICFTCLLLNELFYLQYVGTFCLCGGEFGLVFFRFRIVGICGDVGIWGFISLVLDFLVI